jgi:hypothetical protein
MILDAGTELTPSGGQPLAFGTSGAALTTTLTANAYDFSMARDIGVGERLYVQFQVTEAFTIRTGGPYLEISLLFSNAANFTSDTRLIQHRVPGLRVNDASFQSPEFNLFTTSGATMSHLPLGALFHIELPRTTPYESGDSVVNSAGFTAGVPNYLKRYMCVSFMQPIYSAGVSDFLTGKISARIVLNPSHEHSAQGIYSAAFNIL